jgi:hypothetical protein
MTSSAKTPVARKTRSRKPKAAAKRQTVELSGGVKVTLPEANKTPLKKVTRKPAATKAVKRPSTAKLISFSRYVQDAKVRWAIHEFEINALASDLKKGFTMVQPYGQQLVDQFKN